MNSITGIATMMSIAQDAMTEEHRSEKVLLQMAAQKMKHEWESWKLMEDLKTDIFQIQQEVSLQKAKTDDKIINKWDEFIKG